VSNKKPAPAGFLFGAGSQKVGVLNPKFLFPLESIVDFPRPSVVGTDDAYLLLFLDACPVVVQPGSGRRGDVMNERNAIQLHG
jgi:hypothetical protein